MLGRRLGTSPRFAPKPVGMAFPAEMIDISKYPLAIGLLCAIDVVMIAQYFADRIH